MTDKEINIAIAEACGYRRFVHTAYGWMACTPDADLGPMSDDYLLRVMVPNYCNDLNAIHEAEKLLKHDVENAWLKGGYSLYVQLLPYGNEISATASQRAEAFLRTLGKWEEVQP